jgi:predicted  nucleic acid-binding Zn-ribbon protein
MIITPTENTKLQPDQLTQLEEFQKRLSNLEIENVSAAKILKVSKSDLEKVVKERLYQEELLAKLEKQTEEKTKELEDLNGKCEVSKKTLESDSHQLDEIKMALTEQKSQLEEKERVLISREKDVEEKENKANLFVEEVLKEKSAVEEAKKAFVKAVEFVVWK